jgi:hypothetical protein
MQLTAKQIRELVTIMEGEIRFTKQNLENPTNLDYFSSERYIKGANRKIEAFQAFVDEAKQETEMIQVKIIR